MPFTEDDYKYGSTYQGYDGSCNGCPPALGNDRSVCAKNVSPEEEEEFVLIASKTIKMMKEAMGDNRPDVNITFRSPPYANYGYLHSLELETYLMQEYLKDGENHPLYKAATQEYFKDFQAAFEAYTKSQ